MTISVMSFPLPAAPASPQPESTPAAPAGGFGSTGLSQRGFGGLLASLSAAPRSASRAAQDSPVATTAGSGSTAARDQLQQALSSLAGARVDLNAPGLGLNATQRQQLLSKLEALVHDGNDDGAQLLATLLAGSQLAATLQPIDFKALTQLLGTDAQGAISVGALASNLHLLTQAIQLVSASDGKMTLLQAVQELTPPGDVFTKELAAALIQGQAADTDDPAAADTGPPKTSSSGDEPRDGADGGVSATADSNGRESTVTPTGETSPADGAAQETKASAPAVSSLAKALEELLTTQPKAPAAAAGQPGSPSAAAQASSSTAPSQESQDVAGQLAQMAPGSTSHANEAASKPAAAAAAPAATGPNVDTAVGGTSGTEAAAAKSPNATAAAITAGSAAHDGRDQSSSQGSSGQRTDSASAGGQAQAATLQAPVQGGFQAVLDGSSSVAETQARPALDRAVLDQIVQKATVALNNGQQEFRVQLKPDFLGAMEVRVSMDNGVVSVRMSVESAATRQLIDNNIGQLRQAFGTEHVRVEHVPSFAGSGAPWSFGQGGQQGAWQGQNPYNGSGPLPEAIPFSGDFRLPASAASPEIPAAPMQTPAPSTPGAIDLQA